MQQTSPAQRAAPTFLICWSILLNCPALGQQTATEPTPRASSPGSESGDPQSSQPADSPAKKFESKAWGARPEPSPPSYVRPFSALGLPGTQDLEWLDIGLEHRTRFELRDDDYRRSTLTYDHPFLLRSRGYLGIREILDPFRVAVEFQDAREFNSVWPESTSEVDEAEILQLYGELYFAEAAGANQPLRFQVGRMTFDYLDRRLVARQRWRNTTNAFDGFRIQAGEPDSEWQLDFFAAQPVQIFRRQFNRGDDERWFYGLVGAWRKWDKLITLQPYWFYLDEQRRQPDTADRDIHTAGLLVFGPIGDTGFDYHLNNAFQFGEDGELRHRAYAVYGELGYTFKHDWTPRLSFSATYGSGDVDPNDGTSGRFDRLFAANHVFSMTDFFTWQNTISPRGRLEIQPLKKLKLDTSYAAHWLASDTDTWGQTLRRDSTGSSGTLVGQEVDVRLRYQLSERAEIELGYVHFLTGDFPQGSGDADNSDFFYVQIVLRL